MPSCYQRSPRFNSSESAFSASLQFDFSLLAHSRPCEPSPEGELTHFQSTPPFPETPLFHFSAFGPSGSFLQIPSTPPAEMSPASFHAQSVPESNAPVNQRESSLPMIVGVIGGLLILCAIPIAIIVARSRRPADTEYEIDESGTPMDASSLSASAFLTNVTSYANAVSFVATDCLPLNETDTWRFDEDQLDADAG
jgi:hypothetical protein